MIDPDELDRAERDAAAEARAAAGAAPGQGRRGGPDEPDGAPTTNDFSLAFTPRNVAVGLAIVAGLVALAARRRRRPDTDA